MKLPVDFIDDKPFTARDWDRLCQPARHWRHHPPTRFTAWDLLKIAMTSAVLGVFCLAIWIVFGLL